MNEAILQKTRIWTVLAGTVAAIACGFIISWRFALGLGITVLWAVASFYVLEKLLRSMVVPPGHGRNLFTALAWLIGKLALYAFALWGLLQRQFPGVSHVLGLTLLLIVLVVVGVRAGPQGNINTQPERRGDDG